MTHPSPQSLATADQSALIVDLRAEIARLEAENNDLQMLYAALIEHGEAVEDQLAESNIRLKEIRTRLRGELKDAHRYVMSLLPRRRTEAPKTDWLLVPSTELAGDAFGYHDIDNNHFAVYLLDVCGHGVGAALLSASILNVLRLGGLPDVDFRDPSAVLQGLNDTFPMERQNNMFFTIWYGVYDRGARELRYANGGHPPAFLLRGGEGGLAEVITLSVEDGLAIGVMEDMVFPSESTAVRDGDRIVIVSDGTFELGQDGAVAVSFDDLVAFCRTPGGDVPEAVLAWARQRGDCDALPDDFTYLRVEF